MTAAVCAATESGARLRWHWRTVRLTVAILSGLILACLWTQFGPIALGGKTSFVVTDGTSMLPHFHADGLVITRKASSYRVGEVVAYHNEQLHSVVMHRIVARDGDLYVFKGDNNNFRDTYHPTQSQLVGKEWIYSPAAGRILLNLRQPLIFGIFLGLLTLVCMIGYNKETSRRKRRHHVQ